MDNQTRRRLQVLSQHIRVEENPQITTEETAAKKKKIVPLTSVVERDLPYNPGKNLPREKDKLIKWNGWGYKDTEFLLGEDGVAYVNGNRYLLSGKRLPAFREYFEKYVGVDVSEASPPQTIAEMLKKIPEPKICQSFLDELKQMGEPYKFISFDPENRLLHSHGHSCQEIYQLRHGRFVRVVDVVIYPSCHSDVEKIVKAAQNHPVCIIPYGGGTTVSQSLMCPENEERMIISLDMKEMNSIKWIDFENNLACIEAGAIGIDIDEQLKKQGVCLGHEPDSYEFSSIGGWVATRASGMKKNVYGNIEDFVVRIKCVTSLGTIDCGVDAERKSTGPDLHQLILGSEGTFGVVTEVVVRIQNVPEYQEYGSVVFPDFESGVAAMHEISNKKLAPASIRLLDNSQFAFGQALKIQSEGIMDSLTDWFKKFYITKVCGFDPDKMCAMTLNFEGTKESVKDNASKIYQICSKYGGIKAGSEGGQQGYLLTYVIAYLRDYGCGYYFLGESFETTVPWKNVIKLYNNVKQKMIESGRRRGVPKVWVNARVTQTYRTGACMYFYWGFVYKGLENPIRVFSEIEDEARDEILANGGTLSHHHGVGKLRRKWMPIAAGKTGFEILKKIKKEIDPKNVFAAGNMNLQEKEAVISVSSKLIE